MSVSNIRNLVFDQSSPVQPVSEFRGGPLSVTEKKAEILVSNIGWSECTVNRSTGSGYNF